MTIPDRIMDEARRVYDAICWDEPMSSVCIQHIAKALDAERLAAEQRGREMEREDGAARIRNQRDTMVRTSVETRAFAEAEAAIRSRTTEG